MGFYAPAQIVRDAREHGVEVREVDVNYSDWDCTLEDGALRLGLRQIDGPQPRGGGPAGPRRPYRSVEGFAAAAASRSMRSSASRRPTPSVRSAIDRRAALWDRAPSHASAGPALVRGRAEAATKARS